ncbi:MAG: hypothetical protein AAFR64_10185 [Pseudomonadota bacterium]
MAHPPAHTPVTLTSTHARHDGWTPERQSVFLRALAATHSVAEAAKEAGMSRQSAYALRARLQGEPFDLAWQAALRCRINALAEVALERAIHGVEIQHFYKGEVVGTSRKYDERLTVALLAMQDRLAPPPLPPSWMTHRVEGDFDSLLSVVETGSQTWEEEHWRRVEEELAHGDDPGGHWGLEEEADEQGLRTLRVLITALMSEFRLEKCQLRKFAPSIWKFWRN